MAITKVKQRASGASRFVYTATAGQTTFSGEDDNSQTLSYDIGFVDVYLNGVKMVNGTDVTVNNGTSVVFASGVALNDIVDINTFGTFDLASFDTSSITSGTLNTARLSSNVTLNDGTQTLTNKTLTAPTVERQTITKHVQETATVSATAATGTINYDVNTQSILYYTTNASGNFTVNVRGDGSTSLDSIMDTGDVITVVFLVTNGGTAYYNNTFQIDGSGVTPEWQGGSAPSSGNTNSIDSYTYSIIKTGSATFTALAAQTQFA